MLNSQLSDRIWICVDVLKMKKLDIFAHYRRLPIYTCYTQTRSFRNKEVMGQSSHREVEVIHLGSTFPSKIEEKIG